MPQDPKAASRAPKEDAPAHRVLIVAFPPAQLLDVVGPLEVFAGANGVAARAGRALPYAIEVAAPQAGPLTTTSGVPLLATALSARRSRAPDTLLVSGGPGARAAVADPVLVRRLAVLAERTSRVGSICTGAYTLAATGLLDGRRATTHWAHFEDFAALFPRVEIDREALFVADGKYHTSAGISAGIDSALALVESDLGRAIALEVAQALVVYLKRPGGQSQFSVRLANGAAADGSEQIASLVRWMAAHPRGDLSVEALAERMAMSARTFARHFAVAMRTSPAKYVQALRIDIARRMLTGSDHSIERVAQHSGFASAEAMRTAFQHQLDVSPSEFRRRFRSVAG